MNEKTLEALDQISDRHIEEAAGKQKKRRRPYWLGAVAAVLAVVILVVTLSGPSQVYAETVQEAEYPAYAQASQDGMDLVAISQQKLYGDLIAQVLSGLEGENGAFSPVNLYMALAMLSDLTDGNSKAQIETLLGGNPTENANKIWNACYRDTEEGKTILASSLWLDERAEYRPEAMEALSKNYYTSIYKRDLQDRQTLTDIQDWLNQQTEGLLSDMPPEEVGGGYPDGPLLHPLLQDSLGRRI